MKNIDLLNASVQDFVCEFQGNVFNFLYERDLQSILFSIAYRHFATERVRMRGGFHRENAYGGNNYIDTVPIKCEYPMSQVFDIGLIDSDAVQHYDTALWNQYNWKNDKFWDQPVRAAVELKYYQLGDSIEDKASAYEADVEKLKRYYDKRTHNLFLGIALICIQTEQLDIFPFSVGEPYKQDAAFPQTGVFRYVVTSSSAKMYVT